MHWLSGHRTRHPCEAAAVHILSRFGIAASSAGTLWIRPIGPALEYEELDLILDRILDEAADRVMNELLLDFGQVEWIAPPWTAVVARLIDFARQSEVPCRLVGLHGQPAALISFFGDNPVIRRLLNIDKPAAAASPSAAVGLSA